MVTLISSFYNEEYLLPWWLNHHKKIFDHGILFDYFSSDNSVEIINKICPKWEVRSTKNTDWDPRTNDSEFMEAERELKGYKITLTTTEFLVGFIPKLSRLETCYEIPIVRMVDTEPEKTPVYEKSLIEQKNIGYLDEGFRKRFLHNHPDGAYTTGRDRTNHKRYKIPLWVYKYSYSPWTKQMIKRRLQMQKHMSDEHLTQGWGKQHKHNKAGLEKEYKFLLETANLKTWNYIY